MSDFPRFIVLVVTTTVRYGAVPLRIGGTAHQKYCSEMRSDVIRDQGTAEKNC